ncbi:MAG TPA: RagB/SusD family nutrient uptake outer membrane protein [Puia sp.]|nr:RagB/SusD family nutrient uptake outer membrane protein [Puia sp.]
MNYIHLKKRFATIGLVALAGSFLLGGCTKRFDEYNTNPYGLSNEDLAADYKLLGQPLEQVQQDIYVAQPAWDTQLQQNLIGDNYSGYMGSPTPFLGNQNNMTYALVDGWNGQPWADAYNDVMSPVQSVLKNAGTTYPVFKAWAKILRVEAMHRLSDIYGPIIYTHYGQVNTDGSITYDSQKDAYYAFFADLDSAIAVFTPLAQNSSSPKTFTNFDLVYGGDYKEWTKFANTLKLRLAIRISQIDPAKAQTEGESALANPIGLLTTPADNFNVNIGTFTHPLNVMNNSWGDCRFGAPLASYLTGYSDPRTPKYATPATDPAVAGKVIGVRNGINIDAKGRYEGYSQPVTFPNYSAASGAANFVQLMTAAEAWFLKSEAALRGWAGAGDAGTDYNSGISASFAQFGLDATSYLNDATSTAAQYIDPKAVTPGENDITTGSPYLSTITIKWDNSATFQQKLERIITQKYIAMFPDGQEAWSEFRRTLYPKLYPNTVNFSNGAIPTAKFIRRINFALSERNTNPNGVADAVKKLGGPDTGGTPMWWDVH